MKDSMVIEPLMNAKLKRRAPTTGILVGTRFQATLLEALDRWRQSQADRPTRPEAVRRLIELGMTFSINPSVGSLARYCTKDKSENTP
jgi:hypothetical protein